MAKPFLSSTAAPISFSDKKILVLDDMPDMRTTMRNQMQALGISNISVAATVKDALLLLGQRDYDVILCDYFLGGATDGQQFLEYLRTNNKISRATLFIMITAETGFNSVITAAECLPDDYLLKPFTGETLKIRLERLLERKARLASIDRLQDKGDWPAIIKACDDIIALRDKFMVDAMRIKGNALLTLQRVDDAIKFYQDAIKLRDMPWAKLGLARALKSRGENSHAGQILENLLQDNPKLLAAYDLLGKIHSEAGEAQKALDVLDNACKIAPHSLARQRSIAHLAENIGDYARVDKALSVVVKQTENSPLRNPNDFVKLSNALNETGDLERAIGIIKKAKDSFKESAEVKLFAAIESVTQLKAGNQAAAEQALAIALEQNETQLTEQTRMLIAKACLANGKQEEAKQLVKTLVQNNPDSEHLQEQIAGMFKDHGGSEAAREFMESSVKEVIALNNEAVQTAKAGDYAAAARMLTEAALRLPNNLQIVSNAALSILMDMLMNGYDVAKAMQAKQFQDAVTAQNKSYPKLTEIVAFQAKIEQKYKANKVD